MGAVYPAAQRQTVYREVPILPQGILHNTQHLVHDMRDYWKKPVYSALHYQQEPFDNAAQEHQRVAYNKVQNAVALATSRTAAQMTSRFRDIENNCEANIVSNRENYCPKFLPSPLSHSKLSDTL